ncbi:MAG: serine/threonine protein kinase [Prosthecobacter sp.]|uniref:serine/threonine protein kinase n=1 Tax=Prosthecobacter sp. TaxID=1965333 RepID=UPI0039040CD1
MSPRFEIIRPLEEDTSSKLSLVRDNKRGDELRMRRFRTTKPEEIEGLQELFRQLATLQSPHLDRVIDFGADKDGFYTITAGALPGETLNTVLERGPLTLAEFETVALQLLAALELLHEQSIVHGSLRPDFVRITGEKAADWQVTLHGFGQGFAGRDDSKEEQIRAYRCTAPEQWLDGTTRRRTDVYALGCVLYEALTARPPFDGRVLKELRGKHIGHDLAPLQKLAAHVPSWMCAWVMHLLAADPEQRPRKAAAARELFERREAPNLPELPPLSAAPPVASNTPPVSLVSAPVVLPTAQPASMHATSSTIPIPVGPHVAPTMPRRPTPGPVQRKTYTPPRKPPVTVPAVNKKPFIIAGAAVLLLLIAMLTRCSG